MQWKVKHPVKFKKNTNLMIKNRAINIKSTNFSKFINLLDNGMKWKVKHNNFDDKI